MARDREVMSLALALVVLLWFGFGLLLLNVLMAHVPPLAELLTTMAGAPFVATHFTLGVIASLVALFGVVITMFYFIGTAKAVKEGVRDHDLDRGYYEMTLKYKKKYFPGMTLSLLFYVATPGFGAAVQVGSINPLTHGLVAYLTLIIHLWICVRGQQYLIENDRLVAKVDYLVQKQTRSESTDGDTQNDDFE